MRWSCLLLLTACVGLPLRAQTDPDATPAKTAPPAKRPQSFYKHVERPPASVMPSAQARLSTAQRMAARNNLPPLKELPAFTATNQDGHAITAKTMVRPTHWLLIYRRQNCLPCDRLMNVLAASESAALKGGAPYVILVAGKNSEAVARVQANFSSLSDATWLADRQGKVFAALKPRGTPMIYAMDGSKVAWTVPGNLGSPAKVEKMAAAWVASSPATAAAATSVPASAATPN